MTVARFNRGGLNEALAKFLGLKGAFQLGQDDVILPVISVGDVTASPYLTGFAKGGSGYATTIAVAAKLSYGILRPAPEKILTCHQIWVSNTGGGALAFRIGILSDANAAILTTAPTSTNLQAFGEIPDGPNAARLSSLLLSGGADALDYVTSFSIGYVTVPPGDTKIVDFDPPVVLLGEQQMRNLAVVGQTLNTSLNVTFIVREWPKSG